jgi:hypothetical protein
MSAVSSSFAAAVCYERLYEDTQNLKIIFETTRGALGSGTTTDSASEKGTLTFSDEAGALYVDGKKLTSGASVNSRLELDDDDYFIDGKNIKYSLHLVESYTPGVIDPKDQTPEDKLVFTDIYEMIDMSTWKIDSVSSVYEGELSYVVSLERKQGKNVSAKITSIKSADTKVLSVKKETTEVKGKKYTDYKLKGVKAGKTKITVRYKTSKGKTGTIKRNITVKAYPNPIRHLVVNKKTVNVKKKANYFEYKTSVKTANIKVVPKNGWKIINAETSHFNTKKNIGIVDNTPSKEIINKIMSGKSIKHSKDYDLTLVHFTLKKNNDRITYTIEF